MIVVQGDGKYSHIIKEYFSNVKCKWSCDSDTLYYYDFLGEVYCDRIEELSNNDIILTYRELLEI